MIGYPSRMQTQLIRDIIVTQLESEVRAVARDGAATAVRCELGLWTVHSAFGSPAAISLLHDAIEEFIGDDLLPPADMTAQGREFWNARCRA